MVQFRRGFGLAGEHLQEFFVVGQAGIVGALAILLFAEGITFLTSLSVAAVSTNTRLFLT
jgi:hypothetical protein